MDLSSELKDDRSEERSMRMVDVGMRNYFVVG